MCVLLAVTAARMRIRDDDDDDDDDGDDGEQSYSTPNHCLTYIVIPRHLLTIFHV